MTLDELNWHDGVLEKIVFDPDHPDGCLLAIDLSLYPDPVNASLRTPMTIQCAEVDWFKQDVSVSSLAQNRCAGNIHAGEMLGPLLRIELFGGDLLIKAGQYVLKSR